MSLALAILVGAGAPLADLASIDAEVAAFTGFAIGQPGGAMQPVDRRLRLAPCRSAHALGWYGVRRDTVMVQCPDAGGWRLYVPVKREAPQAAALPAINRGDAVTIAVSGDGFSISQPGEALESGTVGSWIRVRVANGTRRFNSDSLQARVVRPGLVGIPLP